MSAVTKTPAAYRDLKGIVDYLLHRNPDAAHRFLLAVEKAFLLLATKPLLGEAYPHRKHPELRLWILGRRFRNYAIFYRPTAGGVEINRVLHGAQNLPTTLGR